MEKALLPVPPLTTAESATPVRIASPEPLELHYWLESSDRVPLGGAGANIRMVTAAPAITHNVYCEQPYCSAAGSRFTMLRNYRLGPDATSELLVYDIAAYRVARLASEASRPATAAWSGVQFVAVGKGPAARFVRFDLNTLEREDLFDCGALPCPSLYTISGDLRYGLSSMRTSPTTFGILRVDLQTAKWQIIYESPDICNPHLQFRLRTGHRILVQENRGSKFDAHGNMLRACDERGVGLFSIAANGSARHDYPVGLPHTARTTGHECWIGDTDHVLVTVTDYHDDGNHRGTLLECAPEWPKPRVVSTAPQRWNHISASRCGRYFVTDSYESQTTPVIIGSIHTGKWRVLCEPATTGGGGQYSHLHPYLTSDNRWVVFNSDRTGLAQVYLAEVPPEFLAGLD